MHPPASLAHSPCCRHVRAARRRRPPLPPRRCRRPAAPPPPQWPPFSGPAERVGGRPGRHTGPVTAEPGRGRHKVRHSTRMGAACPRCPRPSQGKRHTAHTQPSRPAAAAAAHRGDGKGGAGGGRHQRVCAVEEAQAAPHPSVVCVHSEALQDRLHGAQQRSRGQRTAFVCWLRCSPKAVQRCSWQRCVAPQPPAPGRTHVAGAEAGVGAGADGEVPARAQELIHCHAAEGPAAFSGRGHASGVRR